MPKTGQAGNRTHHTFEQGLPVRTTRSVFFVKSCGRSQGTPVQSTQSTQAEFEIGHVLEPVGRPSGFVCTQAIVSRPPSNSGLAVARQRWWVEVEFNSEADIMIVEKCLAGSSVRLMELAGRFYIEDPVLRNEMEMDDVWRYATDGLVRLNSAIQLCCGHYVPARFLCGVELFQENFGQSFVATHIVHHGKRELEDILTFLRRDDTSFPRIVELCAKHADLGDAIYYFGASGEVWANLYKVCEIVEEYCGGKEGIFQRHWCSRKQWSRFKRTANHHESVGKFSRHARQRVHPPPNPMSGEQAKRLAAGLLRCWILELVERS